MRQTGRLLELAHQIRCPVVAIHGDHDPHPAEGVRVPLLSVLQGFRFVLLDRCGHTPWVERHARERFFRALEEELG
jgi:pimeloyl-ACP methyl ester carboxylesterase